MLMLYFYQQRTHGVRHGFAQQHADAGVEFINVAHGMHAQAALADAGVVAQSGRAVVSGAGGDLSKSVGHVLEW